MIIDRTEHPLRQAIPKRGIEHDGGIVRIPDCLGIEIDPEVLAFCREVRRRRGRRTIAFSAEWSCFAARKRVKQTIQSHFGSN